MQSKNSIKKTLQLLSLCLSIFSATAALPITATTIQSASPRYLKTPHGQIEYYKFGKGEPAIVLVSGYAANVSAWNVPFLMELAQHNQVIVFDNRNVGSSKNTSDHYTSKDLANDTYNLITGLHLNKPALVGISMGGMIAQQFAVLHKNSISSLVLMNTIIAGDQSIKPSTHVQEIVLNTPTGKIRRFIVALRLMAPPLSWIKVTNAIQHERFNPLNHKEIGITEATLKQQQALVEAWSNDNATAQAIAKLNLPVLILNGAKDAMIPPANSDILANTIPHAKLMRWPNGGHIMPYQFPDQIATAITQFVDKEG